jgi:DNA relaxase NicK
VQDAYKRNQNYVFRIGLKFRTDESGWKFYNNLWNVSNDDAQAIFTKLKELLEEPLQQNQAYELVVTGNGIFTVYRRKANGRVVEIAEVTTSISLQRNQHLNTLERIN